MTEASAVAGIDFASESTVVTSWRGPINITPLLAEAVPLARAALLTAAQLRKTVTYGQLSTAVDGRYPPISLGTLLDLISHDCQLRDEPSLAALVIRGDTKEPGDAWIGDAGAEQRSCFARWA